MRFGHLRHADSLLLPPADVRPSFPATQTGFMFSRDFLRTGTWSTHSRIVLLFFLVCSCFFAAQTQPTPTPESGTGIEGVITLSPTHGGPVRPGIPDSTPLANAIFVVENEKGAVASFTTDDQGQFRVSLAPGHYRVSRKGDKPKIGHYGPFDVDVVAGRMTKVAWSCDTGMR
jgi:hypothetical protein